MPIYMGTYMYVCMQVFVCACIFMCICAYKYVCMYVHACRYVCFVYVCVHTRESLYLPVRLRQGHYLAAVDFLLNCTVVLQHCRKYID